MRFVSDGWLSNIIQKDTYQVVLEEKESLEDKIQKSLRDYLQIKNVFMYVKVPVGELETAHFFQKNGFKIADSNIVFEKAISFSGDLADSTIVRFALPEDRVGVEELAGRSFIYSRFHLDDDIPRETANRVKLEWAGNYFLGKRGDWMVVALKENKIVGFLQLLSGDDHTLIIDLIATDSDFRKQGIARGMIAYAETNLQKFEKIRVGTQIVNIPSMRLYEGMGFRVCGADYVFHYHNILCD